MAQSGMFCCSLLFRDLDELVDDDLEAGPHLLAAGHDLVLRQHESVSEQFMLVRYKEEDSVKREKKRKKEKERYKK